jgi:hypothetical protein
LLNIYQIKLNYLLILFSLLEKSQSQSQGGLRGASAPLTMTCVISVLWEKLGTVPKLEIIFIDDRGKQEEKIYNIDLLTSLSLSSKKQIISFGVNPLSKVLNQFIITVIITVGQSDIFSLFHLIIKESKENKYKEKIFNFKPIDSNIKSIIAKHNTKPNFFAARSVDNDLILVRAVTDDETCKFILDENQPKYEDCSIEKRSLIFWDYFYQDMKYHEEVKCQWYPKLRVTCSVRNFIDNTYEDTQIMIDEKESDLGFSLSNVYSGKVLLCSTNKTTENRLYLLDFFDKSVIKIIAKEHRQYSSSVINTSKYEFDFASHISNFFHELFFPNDLANLILKFTF